MTTGYWNHILVTAFLTLLHKYSNLCKVFNGKILNRIHTILLVLFSLPPLYSAGQGAEEHIVI